MNAPSTQDKLHRKSLSDQTHQMVRTVLYPQDTDETISSLEYNGFYLQIAFSEVHPLMVFYLAKGIDNPGANKKRLLLNELNLHSVLGSHAINTEVSCYSFRSAHWIDCEITELRFIEILERCTEEAMRGYSKLVN